jgi:hypothetical protein
MFLRWDAPPKFAVAAGGSIVGASYRFNEICRKISTVRVEMAPVYNRVGLPTAGCLPPLTATRSEPQSFAFSPRQRRERCSVRAQLPVGEPVPPSTSIASCLAWIIHDARGLAA